MTQPKLYTDWAELWPYLQDPDDVAEETEDLRDLLINHLDSSRSSSDTPGAGDKRTLLELGAGGGATLAGLADDFACTALDLSQPMLDLVARLPFDIATVLGDMRSARLGRAFDAVLCNDAIDHLATPEDAQACLATIAQHLAPQGLAVVAPTYTAETFVDGDWSAARRPPEALPPEDGGEFDAAFDADDPLELTVLSVAHRTPGVDHAFDLTVAIVVRDRATGEVQTLQERQRCGLFSEAWWTQAASAAGLQARWWDAGPDSARWLLTRRC
ncbi:MAG: class I SAM-dependent methyltransferase [Planctomycetota bacterium]